MSEVLIERMVQRFLAWKLPQGFAPDAGITFSSGHMSQASPLWPTGTNLFTAEQAREMVEYMLSKESWPDEGGRHE